MTRPRRNSEGDEPGDRSVRPWEVNEVRRREDQQHHLHLLGRILALEAQVVDALNAADEASYGGATHQIAALRELLEDRNFRLRLLQASMRRDVGYPRRLTAADVPIGTAVYIIDHIERPRCVTRNQGSDWEAEARCAHVVQVGQSGVWVVNRMGMRLWRPFSRICLADSQTRA